MVPPRGHSSPPVFDYDDESELVTLDGVSDVDSLIVTEFKMRGFVIIRHEYGRLLKALLGATSKYFDLDEEEKIRIAGGEKMRKAQGRPVGYSRRDCGEFVDLHIIRDQAGVTLLPEGFNHGGFKAPLVAHIMNAANIAKALCACVTRSLGGPSGALESCVDLFPPVSDEISKSTVRLCSYTSGGFEPHTDTSFLTVVAANSDSGASPGLEILSPQNHEWEAVDRYIADGETIVVFPGDFMSIVTNNIIPAAAHRSTLGPTSSNRISIPVLFRTLSGSYWPPGVGGEFLNCDEPLPMDDIDMYCECKRKSNAARHLLQGDKDWILETRTFSPVEKPST